MTNEKGLYWLALGVVALVFVNGTQFGRQNWLSRLEDRSIGLVQRLSGHTAAALNLTEMRLAAQPYRSPRSQATAARMQAQFACMEGALAHQQAEFAQIQAERARLEALQQLRLAEMRRHRGFVIQAPEVRAIPTEGTI